MYGQVKVGIDIWTPLDKVIPMLRTNWAKHEV